MEQAPHSKKARRTLSDENRQFNLDWEVDFFMTSIGNTMMCLRCKQTIKSIKRSNAKQHYDSCKSSAKYMALQGAERSEALNTLKSNHKKEAGLFAKFKPNADNPEMEATYRVAFLLGAKGKPYADVELFKECLLEVVQCISPSELQKYKDLPLSRRTVVRRQEELAANVVQQLEDICKEPDSLFSLALDESCDATDTAQLCIFIRITTPSFQIHDELLSLASLKSTTRGTDIFSAVIEACADRKLDLRNLVGICTDGAPAMRGSTAGFVALLKQHLETNALEGASQELLVFHCIIHQQALCAKSATLHDTVEQAILIVNFIRSRALHHRQFRQLLVEDESTEKCDIIYDNNVRWLSKGAVIKRIISLENHIKEFYLSKNTPCKLNDPNFCMKLAFLGDLLDHLNGLNQQLQGPDQSICKMWRTVKVFIRKLKLFHSKFERQELSEHFPLLKEFSAKYPDETLCHAEFSAVFTVLIDEFDRRFSDFQKHHDSLRLVSEPHLLEPESVAEKFQLELLELSEDTLSQSILTQQHRNLADFWRGAIKYPNLRHHARRVLTCFGSTYLCEAAFSHMNYLKNQHRTELTDSHLQDQLRLRTTDLVPQLKKLSALTQFQKSH